MSTAGHALLYLAEIEEWNRVIIIKINGLIDWRLMGYPMVPTVQTNISGLHHDCSTWDELYEDDHDELVNAWNGPTSSIAPISSKKAKTMASSSSATVLSDIANALIPGAEP